MAYPILYNIVPFDALKIYTLPFTWAGNQSVKNKLTIKNNKTNAIIFEDTITTYKLSHDIPSSTLRNGETYAANIITYDTNNTASSESNTLIFKCLKEPVFAFSNLVENQKIQNSYYRFQILYSQEQDEQLDTYTISLYNFSKVKIYSTGTIYDTLELAYKIPQLLDKTNYFINATGKTVSGILVETNLIPFYVEYLSPQMFQLMYAENNEKDATISVTTNIISADGESKKEPIYINNECVDLRDNTITYNNGYTLPLEFSLEKIIKSVVVNNDLLRIEGMPFIVLRMYKCKKYSLNEGKYYLNLKVKSGYSVYTLDTKPFSYFDGDKLHIFLRRKNEHYTLKVATIRV